jgi:hypothetical protein
MIHRLLPEGPSELIAEGVERLEPTTEAVDGKPHGGLERCLVTRSFPLAHPGTRGLRARLAMAQAVIGTPQCAPPGPARLPRRERPAGGWSGMYR